MVKKVTKEQQKEILESFLSGKSIKVIAKGLKYTETTITRQLKNLIGEDKFLKIKNETTSNFDSDIRDNPSLSKKIKNNNTLEFNSNNYFEERKLDNEEISDLPNDFYEITPLTEGIDLNVQKDITSVNLSEVEFPKVLYMIVDKKIELETKMLKDFPDWQFLPEDDLNRKTIQIFYDLKIAKKNCNNNNQKVIKVPNTDVFRIVAPLLKARGISRLITEEKLIAL